MNECFRQIVDVPKSGFLIEYQHKTIFLGSCFADNMGSRFASGLLDCLTNPYGVAFNPASVGQALERMMSCAPVDASELIECNGLWHHPDFHGSFSRPGADEVVAAANRATAAAHDYLREADNVVLTFGTAWVYRLRSTGRVVANCHKLPQDRFERERLRADDIAVRWLGLLADLKSFGKPKNIILTVSPVRHIKDGAHGNAVSKSELLLAADALERSGAVYYFPSFELMMDDLRDYRFYADDYFHPNAMSVNYIMSKFMEATFDSTARSYHAEGAAIVRRLEHRPLNGLTAEYVAFMEQTLEQLKKLKVKYPLANVCTRISELESQLSGLKDIKQL